MESVLELPAAPTAAPAGSWINGRRWDTAWLIGSAIVVPLVLVLVWGGINATVLNFGVTLVVGGPHVFSTFLATYADPRFRRSHAWVLLGASVLVPVFVVAMTLTNYPLLLSVFIFAASLHVIQQNAYLSDIYRKRAGRREPAWSRAVDYGLMGVAFYPVASYKLVHDAFKLGDVQILIPSFTKCDATWMILSAAFAGLALAWIGKTAAEWRRGELNAPKTVLIGVTSSIAFLVPTAAAGSRLELAFQSVNMWHSIQYLGIVWIVLKVRKERGLLDNRLIAGIAGPGRATAKFYGTCVALAVGLFAVVGTLTTLDPFALRFEQYYYMAILSALLVHYVLDGYLFTVSNTPGAELETNPFAAPAAA